MPLLLIATLIAVSATVASAECAWVLWNQYFSFSSTPGFSASWTIEGGYKTAAECATEQARWWDANMKELSNREKYPRVTKVEGERPKSIHVTVTKDSLVTELNNDYSRRVLCLPDTIDPREAKGAGPGARRDR